MKEVFQLRSSWGLYLSLALDTSILNQSSSRYYRKLTKVYKYYYLKRFIGHIFPLGEHFGRLLV